MRCEYLVGADGPRSSVRRQLGVGAFATYVTLQDFCRVEGAIEPYFDCIYMRDIGDSFGYAYVVPKGDVAIIGSVFYPKTKRPHEKHDQVIATLKQKLPLGESVKREAWVALSVRHRDDVVPGSAACCSPERPAASCRPPRARASPTRSTPDGSRAPRSRRPANGEALAAYESSTSHIARNIARKLKWLPFMESRTGKYLAGFVPTPIVSRITKGL